MDNWAYWQKVVIVMLTIVVVVLAYRRILRWVGGNSRFDDHFAFLMPLEKEAGNKLLVRFDLPVKDTISLSFIGPKSTDEVVLVNETALTAGTHQFDVDISSWEAGRYTVVLKSGNQKIERFFENL